MRGLTFCLTKVAVKTTCILMNESGQILTWITPSSSSSPRKSRSRVKKTPGTRELVVGTVAYEHHVAELPDRFGCSGSEFPRQVEWTRTQDEMERRLPHSGSTGDSGKKTRVPGSTAVRKAQKENPKECLSGAQLQ